MQQTYHEANRGIPIQILVYPRNLARSFVPDIQNLICLASNRISYPAFPVL
jgi:hypothetical protein